MNLPEPLTAKRHNSPAGAAATAWCRAKQECGPGRRATTGSALRQTHRALSPVARFKESRAHLPASVKTEATRVGGQDRVFAIARRLPHIEYVKRPGSIE